MPTNEDYVAMKDGARLFVETLGTGDETLLILNGFCLFPDFKYLAESRTLVSLDLRNRGRSDCVADFSNLQGVQQDVDDIEAVRHHFGFSRLDLLAHSYAGMIPVLYSMKYPDRVRRIVQFSPIQPDQSVQYPAHLMNADETFQALLSKLSELQTQREDVSTEEFCRRLWLLLRRLYVFDPRNVDKINHWESWHLPAELNAMRYWMEVLQPSLQRLHFTWEDFAKVQAPVLTIHGTKDRSAPYGGGRDWALRLPNARLLTVENVAHAPWIEAPEQVLPSIQTFLGGTWPEAAEEIERL